MLILIYSLCHPVILLGGLVWRRRGTLYLTLLLVIAIIATSLIYFNTRRHRGGSIPLLSIAEGKPGTIRIESPVITNGSQIPIRYTCDGTSISPPLIITNIPSNAKELVLVMYDPDAPSGIFYHWLLYDIPARTKIVLPEALPPIPVIEGLGAQGVNSYNSIGYGPPCPPRGSKHRYIFLVVGLDAELRLPPGLGPKELLSAIAGHVVAYGVLYGVYQR